MSITATIANNLKTLRTESGLSQAAIAKFLGVDQSMISKAEAGERAFSADIIEKLSSLYGVPVSAIDGENGVSSPLSHAFRTATVADDDLQGVSVINRLALNSVFLDNLINSKPMQLLQTGTTGSVPKSSTVKSGKKPTINETKIIVRAGQIRQRLGEDSDSPVDIFAMVQNIDRLTIVYYPLGDSLSGVCVKSEAGNIIAINSGMTIGRQRFSLAHELYHLYFDDNMSAFCSKSIDTGSLIEREADLFASYFLMPPAALATKADELRKSNGNRELSMRDVIRIEQFFGVSHQAAVIRLKKDGYLSNSASNTLMCQSVKVPAAAMGFRTTLYMPTPESHRYMTYGSYISQVETAYDQDLISTGKYNELLLDAFRADIVYGLGESEGIVID